MIRKRINIGWVMLLSSGLIILFDDLPVYQSITIAFHTATSIKTLCLIIDMYLIMLLENVMRENGMINTIVTNLKQVSGSNRIASAFLPAVVGLLPSMGGARFSCPLVNESIMDNANAETKAFINTWYRHVLMDGFILYPGIILAAGILNVHVSDLFVRLSVFMIITAIAGVFFGTANVKYEKTKIAKCYKTATYSLLLKISPIVAIISLYIALLKSTSYALEISILAVITVLLITFKYTNKQIWTALRQAFIFKYIVIILGVMIFKDILISSSIIENLPNLIESFSVPKQVLFILLPFLAGVLTGMSVGIVSISFPILLVLGLSDNLWYGAIAYAAGQIGQMVTPLHLCNVITAEYFKVPVNKLLSRIAIAEIPVIVMLVVFIIFL